jgi:hypothetical protein
MVDKTHMPMKKEPVKSTKMMEPKSKEMMADKVKTPVANRTKPETKAMGSKPMTIPMPKDMK